MQWFGDDKWQAIIQVSDGLHCWSMYPSIGLDDLMSVILTSLYSMQQ